MPTRSVSAPPRPSPRDTLKVGRKTLKVGDMVTLQVPIQRIGPFSDQHVGDGITVKLPDGTRHTFSPRALGLVD